MKILEAKGELVESKTHPLFECKMTHQIKQTTASFRYKGPKFNANNNPMWNEILAFFKWSYTKTHGETQVRLFVHPTQGWKAWAFPQEASTGLSTRELPDDPNTAPQRAQFGDDWLLYGTVHHHCSASAFQSGTDTANEKDQEGIHITVGDMDKEKYTLDCRFYYRGCKFKPDMTEFWDVGQLVRDKADEYADMFGVSPDLNRIAEQMMVIPPAADTPFPDAWVANLIEKKWPAWSGAGNGEVYTGKYGRTSWDENDPGYQGFPSKGIKMLRAYVRKTYYKDDIKKAGNKMTPEIKAAVDEQVAALLDDVVSDGDIMAVFNAVKQHNCLVLEMVKRFNEILILENKDKSPNEDEQKAIQQELDDVQTEMAVEKKRVHEMSAAEYDEYCKQQEIGFGCT